MLVRHGIFQYIQQLFASRSFVESSHLNEDSKQSSSHLCLMHDSPFPFYLSFVCMESSEASKKKVCLNFFLSEFSRCCCKAGICLKWNFPFLFSSSRMKNFCGSIADSVQSKTNTLHIRYFADSTAINSSFNILYTAYREKGNKGWYPALYRRVYRRSEFNLLPFYFLYTPLIPLYLSRRLNNPKISSKVSRWRVRLRGSDLHKRYLRLQWKY